MLVTRLMCPTMSHAVLNLGPTICTGGSEFCAATLLETSYGVFHTFAANDLTTNTQHPSSRLLLNRMMIYFEQEYVAGRDKKVIHSEHLPNPSDADGMLNIVALANLVELGIILSHKSYQSGGLPIEEHLQFISARRSSRRLIAFLDMRYEVIESDGARSISEMQSFWLANQIATLEAHITTYPEDFVWNNPEAFNIFKSLTATFVREYGGPDFGAFHEIADRKRYAYPGKIEKIVDNWEVDELYGECLSVDCGKTVTYFDARYI